MDRLVSIISSLGFFSSLGSSSLVYSTPCAVAVLTGWLGLAEGLARLICGHELT